MLRAETRPLSGEPRSRASAWLAAAVAAPRALFGPSVQASADPPAAPARHAPRARIGSARLAQGPTASPLATLPAAELATQPGPAAPAASSSRGERTRTARSDAASDPSPSPEEPSTPAAPPEPPPVAEPSEPPAQESAPPGVEVEAEVDVAGDAAPVGADVLVDLSPGDFQGSLGTTLPVGGAAIDVQLQEGAVAVDTSLRVETPDLGVSGPTAAAAQLQLAPGALASELALGAGGAGAGVRVGAGPDRLGSDVALDVAGASAALAVATGSDGVAIDVTSGALVPVLLGGNEVEVSTEKLLPIDLPLDLELRLH